jgi:hypothetical protein
MWRLIPTGVGKPNEQMVHLNSHISLLSFGVLWMTTLLLSGIVIVTAFWWKSLIWTVLLPFDENAIGHFLHLKTLLLSSTIANVAGVVVVMLGVGDGKALGVVVGIVTTFEVAVGDGKALGMAVVAFLDFFPGWNFFVWLSRWERFSKIVLHVKHLKVVVAVVMVATVSSLVIMLDVEIAIRRWQWSRAVEQIVCFFVGLLCYMQSILPFLEINSPLLFPY